MGESVSATAVECWLRVSRPGPGQWPVEPALDWYADLAGIDAREAARRVVNVAGMFLPQGTAVAVAAAYQWCSADPGGSALLSAVTRLAECAAVRPKAVGDAAAAVCRLARGVGGPARDVALAAVAEADVFVRLYRAANPDGEGP